MECSLENAQRNTDIMTLAIRRAGSHVECDLMTSARLPDGA
jgi:hypothetical protein